MGNEVPWLAHRAEPDRRTTQIRRKKVAGKGAATACSMVTNNHSTAPQPCPPSRRECETAVASREVNVLTGAPQLRDLSTMQTSERWALVESLIAVFQTAFGELNFQLVAASATINAQAIVLEQSPCVRIYGGLAFHPLLGSDAITFALLHETGHHLAAGCRQPWNPWIACECVADQWAAREGAKILETATGHKLNTRRALESLEAIIEPACYRQDQLAELGLLPQDRGGCWALSWSKRKESILSKPMRPVESVCPLAYLVLSNG
jgi:hypothetical protein